MAKLSDMDAPKENEAPKSCAPPDAQGRRDRATGFKEYHVFKIIRSRRNPGCGVEFLVQWVGFRETDATWEPRAKIDNIAPLAVQEFNDKERERKGRIKKRLSS
ncbi:hypothetical protein FMUND_14853 [Fusarium mundagurra]|uniref:Chromo domain-containing protein n=1 Tax=Fusarium mundagurra TaxID=1567541 RepID=A0A8H5XTB0_9HYPO|nr:hypothetical protein FMUND_14853 [Fusarium mundagurra]